MWEVIDGAATKPFGFMRFYPGPGIGGHCIPLDPHYLSWKLKTLNYSARFIELASEINGNMPHVVVRRAGELLNQRRKSVNGSRVLVLGVAYKRDTNDVRESPALDIMRLLEEQGAPRRVPRSVQREHPPGGRPRAARQPAHAAHARARRSGADRHRPRARATADRSCGTRGSSSTRATPRAAVRTRHAHVHKL